MPFGAIIPFGLVFAMVLDARRRRTAILLGYIHQAVRLNLPLGYFLGSVGYGEKGRMSRCLLRLASGLARGEPLGHALSWAAPEVSLRERSLITSAERIGRIEPALCRIVSRRRITPAMLDPREACMWAYPFALIAMLLLVLSGMMAFVMPKFEEIFRDFDTRLPDITIALVRASRVYAAPLSMLVGTTVLGVGVWLFLLLIGVPMQFLADAIDPLVSHIPVVHGIKRDRALGDAFAIMHEAIAAGAPMSDAAAEASQLHLPWFMRSRMRRFVAELQRGAQPGTAAAVAYFPSVAAGMLATSSADDQMLHTTAFLASYYTSRFSRAAAICRGAITPIVVIILGCIVGAGIYGIFAPVAALIDGVNMNHELGGGIM